MMMSGMYQKNALSLVFFLVLGHWNNCAKVDMSLYYIIMATSQIVFHVTS